MKPNEVLVAGILAIVTIGVVLDINSMSHKSGEKTYLQSGTEVHEYQVDGYMKIIPGKDNHSVQIEIYGIK